MLGRRGSTKRWIELQAAIVIAEWAKSVSVTIQLVSCSVSFTA